MLKKTIKYTDYNGVERSEDFWFNLTEAELSEMELSVAGGLKQLLDTIVQTQDAPSLIKFFKELILKAYGVKSADGKYFRKSEEFSNDFASTEAYSVLFMELATNDNAAADFVNGIIPANLRSTNN